MKQRILDKLTISFALWGMALFLFAGCNENPQVTDKRRIPDFSNQNFSNLTIDSNELFIFLQNIQIPDSIRADVKAFYLSRQYQYAWVTQHGVTVSAHDFYERLKTDRIVFDDPALNNHLLDSLFEELAQNEKSFLLQRNKVQQLEGWLTTSFFLYAEKMYVGTSMPLKDLEWFIPRKKKDLKVYLDSLVSIHSPAVWQEPVNAYYLHLKEKLKEYRLIEKNGGWPKITADMKNLSLGMQDSGLVLLKNHLRITGDFYENDSTLLFTDSLMNAIKNFQQRMGLSVTGKIDQATTVELNKPVSDRIKQIMVNMERLRWIPVEMEKNYLLVNIPEFKLHVIENGKQVWVTPVVVGKALRETSIFTDKLSQIILNPYWNVPSSITQNEIIPHIRRNANYLNRNHMEVVSRNPLVVRQKPGSGNALGKVKFLFPNHYNIYLHDTPSKGLFEETNRAFSHGCIRVKNPEWLALYLMRNDPSWNEKRMQEIWNNGAEYKIDVKPVVPIYIVYFTAWVNLRGQLNFRNDLYGLDKKMSKEIFAE